MCYSKLWKNFQKINFNIVEKYLVSKNILLTELILLLEYQF